MTTVWLRALLIFITMVSAVSAALAEDVSLWGRQPTDWKGVAVSDDAATLTGDKWSYLIQRTSPSIRLFRGRVECLA